MDFTEDGFYQFMAERHQMYLRRERGGLAPWTKDPTLGSFHFCNIFRELDRGSQWYMEYLTGYWPDGKAVDSGAEEIIFRTVFYRLVNMVWWFEEVSESLNLTPQVPGLATYLARRGRMLDAAKPLSMFNPAHRILQGKNIGGRHAALTISLDWLADHVDKLAKALSFTIGTFTQQDALKIIRRVPFVGGFIGLQIVRDLKLRGWPIEEDEWCFIGPGAIGTLKEMYPDPVPNWSPQAQMKALADWQEKMYPRLHIEGPRLRGKYPNICDIEHALCEYGKYVKYTNGGGTRRKYLPGGGPVRYVKEA